DNYATNSQFETDHGKMIVRIKKHLGGANQEADGDLVSEVAEWTNEHRLRGCAYLYVRLFYEVGAYQNGVPNVSATIRGKKVYDPRTDSSAFSNNWALCVRDYVTNTTYGLGAGDHEIDEASFIAAANIADENVNLSTGTQKRYTLDGIVDTANKPIDVLSDMANASAGAISYSGGRFTVFAGAYDTPTASLDETWLRGNLQVMDKPSRKDTFNSVIGTFVDPEQLYQPTDFPEVTNALYVTEDSEEKSSRDVELKYTTDAIRAQRIAKVYLEQERQGITVTMPCNMKALTLKIYDTVQLSIDVLGWENKVFRVLGWQIANEGNGYGVDLSLKEEASTVYDWNSGEATVRDSAPDTNLPSPHHVEPAGAPTAVEELYVTTNGSGVKTRIDVAWAESPDVFATRYNVYIKHNGDATFTLAGRTTENKFTIYDLSPGTYTLAIETQNGLGVLSAPAEGTVEVVGLTVPPADIENFTLNVINGQAHLNWNQVPDLDVRIGGRIRVRHTPNTDAPSWSNATDITPALPGIAATATLPLLNGTYMVKAIDSTGNESVSATVVTTNAVSLISMNVVETIDEHTSFAGSKTNLIVNDDGALMLNGSTLFEDMTGDFDDITGNFDAPAGTGFETSGEYLFENTLDLGAVHTSQVRATLNAAIYDGASTFDASDGNFDDAAGLFDGEDITGIDVKLMVRTTANDPEASPTWTAWQPFILGDYTARAFEFKVVVTSERSNLNLSLSTLSLSVDMPDLVQSDTVSAPDTGLSVVFDQAFKLASPHVGVTIQNAQSGDYFTLSSLTAQGFSLDVYDSTDTQISRDVMWFAKGY
ncbi:MAG: phage tail protein, partial [Alphaproteobacteria bacterium]|nr:phage tail protein [Alphaproteobacteria bacterium]